MSVAKSKRIPALMLSVLIALFVGVFGSGVMSARADEEIAFIPTWEEYIEQGGVFESWNDAANAIDRCMEASIKYYEAGDQENAYTAALNIYNFYYETSGFERAVNGYSGSEVSKAELQFKTARKTVKKATSAGDIENIKAEFEKLSVILHTQANHLDGVDAEGVSGINLTGEQREDPNASAERKTVSGGTVKSSPTLTFLSCFGIILREGLEAILVVGAIIAYLVKSGNKDKLKAVYLGCALAMGASFLSAWLLDRLKLANTANQEIIEGVTALIAVIVLFYVSNWMVSKAEADAWNKYIDDQIKISAETGSVFTLGFTAFLAVFREGAEVILFYQPLMNGDNMKYVWGGFGVGCVVLVFVFLAIRFLSVKLPLRPFFLGTSILMFIMSVSFLGSGIKELIEGDVIEMTSPEFLQAIIPFNDTLDVLGIYPVLETLIPQLILILLTVTIFVIQKWSRNSHVECGLIAIVFGSIGLHKFYVGKYGRGMLYILFCWCGIPALIGILEGIHYLSESQQEFEDELKPKPKKKKEKKPAKA